MTVTKRSFLPSDFLSLIRQGAPEGMTTAEVACALVNPGQIHTFNEPPSPSVAGWREQAQSAGIDDEDVDDLSELGSEAFVTSGEEENIGDPDFYSLLEDTGDIANRKLSPTVEENDVQTNKAKNDRDQRVLSTALNMLHRSAKLQVAAISRVQAVVKRSPDLASIAELLKPFSSFGVPKPTTAGAIPPIPILPRKPTTAAAIPPIPILPSKSSKETVFGVKLRPQNVPGTRKYKCPLCPQIDQGWWAKIDAHIRLEHMHEMYGPCQKCRFT